MEDFENIQPYTDEEAVAALQKVARHPILPAISKFIFPEFPIDTLSKMLKGIKSVEDFQYTIVSKAVNVIVGRSSSGFTFEGVENLRKIPGKFLAISNHRDIILDPALTQWMLMLNNIPMTEICVGSNLLSSGIVEALLRSKPGLSSADAEAFLADHDGEGWAICVHARPVAPPDPPGLASATNYAFVADLASRRFRFAMGNPCQSSFRDVEI